MDTGKKIKKLFGSRIKSLREGKGLTQERLAEWADMNSIYLSNIERGKENPTLNLIIRISIALEVDILELFDFKHEEGSKVLREMVKKLVNEIDDDKKLKTVVRIVRAVIR